MSFSGSLLSGAAFYGSEYYGSGLIVGSFSPASLFASSEVGAWYDPSDLTTLFQDDAGTQPVTEAGQRVALMLDKSRGLVLGPELFANPSFDSGTTGWTANAGTFTATSGEATWTYGGAGNVYLFQSVGVAIGKIYELTINVVSVTGAVRIILNGGSSTSSANLAPGVTTVRIFASAGVNGNAGLEGTGNISIVLGSFSIRELPGFHATQSVLAQRPTYAVEPVTGRRNLLLNTENFNTTSWTTRLANATLTHSIADPLGGTSAVTLTSIGAAGRTSFSPGVSIVSGTPHVTSVWLRRRTGTGDVFVYTNSAGIGTTVVQAITSEWQRYTFAVTPSFTGDGYPGVALGTIGDAIDMWGWQFELGSTATAYQRVVTAQDVSEAGVAARHYLFFDGIDDGMLTSTITPGVDKVAVFAGVRKLSDAARGTIAELTASAAANNGAFHLTAPNAASDTFAFESKGTSLTDAVASGVAAPASRVLAGLGDIAGDTATLRVNGVQADQDTGDQGTGNYAAAVLYLGRRGGASLPFSGHLYGAVVRFSSANLANASIAATERWMAQRTGVVI